MKKNKGKNPVAESSLPPANFQIFSPLLDPHNILETVSHNIALYKSAVEHLFGSGKKNRRRKKNIDPSIVHQKEFLKKQIKTAVSLLFEKNHYQYIHDILARLKTDLRWELTTEFPRQYEGREKVDVNNIGKYKKHLLLWKTLSLEQRALLLKDIVTLWNRSFQDSSQQKKYQYRAKEYKFNDSHFGPLTSVFFSFETFPDNEVYEINIYPSPENIFKLVSAIVNKVSVREYIQLFPKTKSTPLMPFKEKTSAQEKKDILQKNIKTFLENTEESVIILQEPFLKEQIRQVIYDLNIYKKFNEIDPFIIEITHQLQWDLRKYFPNSFSDLRNHLEALKEGYDKWEKLTMEQKAYLVLESGLFLLKENISVPNLLSGYKITSLSRENFCYFGGSLKLNVKIETQAVEQHIDIPRGDSYQKKFVSSVVSGDFYKECILPFKVKESWLDFFEGRSGDDPSSPLSGTSTLVGVGTPSTLVPILQAPVPPLPTTSPLPEVRSDSPQQQ